MSEIDAIKHHLDAVSGAQIVMQAALCLLLKHYHGNAQAIVELHQLLESSRANLLASQASEYKIQAFEESAAILIAGIISKP